MTEPGRHREPDEFEAERAQMRWLGLLVGLVLLAATLVLVLGAGSHSVSHSAVTPVTSPVTSPITTPITQSESKSISKSLAPLASASPTFTPQPPVTYTVKPGDNLTSIAATFKVHGQLISLYDWNKSVVGQNPNLIYPGQVLVVSPGDVITVGK